MPTIFEASRDPIGDTEIEQLLFRAYVDAGFTLPEVARTMFAAEAVRQRGRLLFARGDDRSLAGMVIVAGPSSPARRIARNDEVEMHLLAVAPERRDVGLGRTLVDAALAAARHDGARHMVLWTQPSMHAAQRLYERCGFVRAPERDFVRDDGQPFMVYAIAL